ncbi:MAG: hypothetical protein CMQ24_03425 [Gammaproteobacteria bacterium]|nr:hypothetical protein [Gammaproteobacteria bacterium]
MNCLDFRREALADPRLARTEPALAEHAAACDACRRFAGELAALDAEIERALDVPVPEGLAARIMLRTSGHGSDDRRSRTRARLCRNAGRPYRKRSTPGARQVRYHRRQPAGVHGGPVRRPSVARRRGTAAGGLRLELRDRRPAGRPFRDRDRGRPVHGDAPARRDRPCLPLRERTLARCADAARPWTGRRHHRCPGARGDDARNCCGLPGTDSILRRMTLRGYPQ